MRKLHGQPPTRASVRVSFIPVSNRPHELSGQRFTRLRSELFLPVSSTRSYARLIYNFSLNCFHRSISDCVSNLTNFFNIYNPLYLYRDIHNWICIVPLLSLRISYIKERKKKKKRNLPRHKSKEIIDKDYCLKIEIYPIFLRFRQNRITNAWSLRNRQNFKLDFLSSFFLSK